jgi:hypothetical protein
VCFVGSVFISVLFCFQLSRLERVSSGPEYCHELFVDVEPIFVSDKTSPPRDAIVLLITLCGGKVSKTV